MRIQLGCALRFAANNNQVACIDLLVDAGADLEAKDRKGRTALVHASGNERTRSDATADRTRRSCRRAERRGGFVPLLGMYYGS